MVQQKVLYKIIEYKKRWEQKLEETINIKAQEDLLNEWELEQIKHNNEVINRFSKILMKYQQQIKNIK